MRVGYGWLNFLVLFGGIFAMNYFSNVAKNAIAASTAFTLMLLAVYGLKRWYDSTVEKIEDERTESIQLRTLYYGSIAFLIVIAYEIIWMISGGSQDAIVVAKFLVLPLAAFIATALAAKLHLKRVM